MISQKARHAKQLLALSLWSSLALLSACGGGGDDKPAAAAPQAASAPPDKTVLEAADPNEPYVVTETTSEVGRPPNVVKQTDLNVIDGILQKVKKTIPISNAPKQYAQFSKYVANGDAKLLTPYVLVYIQDNKLYKIDLARASGAASVEQLRSAAAICEIDQEGSYPLKQDQSAYAVRVLWKSNASDCSDTTVPAFQSMISTDAGASFVPAIYPASIKALQYYFEGNELTGVLVENWRLRETETSTTVDTPIPPDQVTSSTSTTKSDAAGYSQITVVSTYNSDKKETTSLTNTLTKTRFLEVRSPDLSTALVTPLALPHNGSDLTSLHPDSSLQLVTRAPQTYSEGYVKLHVPETDPTLGAPKVGTVLPSSFNVLYRIKWEGALKKATVIEITDYTPVDDSPTFGLTDDKYVYFYDQRAMFFGPSGKSNIPFIAKSDNVAIDNVLGDTSFKLVSMTQTPKNLVMTFVKDGSQRVIGINKETGFVGFLAAGSTTALTYLGRIGEVLYFSNVDNSNLDRVFLFKSDITKIGDISNSYNNALAQIRDVEGLSIVGKLVQRDNSIFDKELSSLIACQPSQLNSKTCGGVPLKLFDVASEKFTAEIGTYKPEDSLNYAWSVSGMSGQSGLSNTLLLKKTTFGGNKFTDSFVFHPGAPRSLKVVERIENAAK